MTVKRVLTTENEEILGGTILSGLAKRTVLIKVDRANFLVDEALIQLLAIEHSQPSTYTK